MKRLEFKFLIRTCTEALYVTCIVYCSILLSSIAWQLLQILYSPIISPEHSTSLADYKNSSTKGVSSQLSEELSKYSLFGALPLVSHLNKGSTVSFHNIPMIKLIGLFKGEINLAVIEILGSQYLLNEADILILDSKHKLNSVNIFKEKVSFLYNGVYKEIRFLTQTNAGEKGNFKKNIPGNLKNELLQGLSKDLGGLIDFSAVFSFLLPVSRGKENYGFEVSSLVPDEVLKKFPGIIAGDVITHLFDVPIHDYTPQQLAVLIGERDEILIRVERDSKILDVIVSLK